MSTTTPQPKFALIIGGTGFISQYCVEELHAAGFTVTTMNRGSSFDLHKTKVSHRFIVNCRKRKEFVTALRNSVQTMKDLGFGIGNAWDLVIDFICYEPPHAEDCSLGLTGICKLFTMISTDSIYEVCQRPGYLDQVLDPTTSKQLTAPQEAPTTMTTTTNPTHPGRREEDQSLLNVSEKELRQKDEYGLEKLQCEQVFLKHANESTHNSPARDQSPYPFETVWLRLPDVTGERELPRNRHFQLQMRIQLGLPIYIDPESNHYDVDLMNLPQYYDPVIGDGIINRLPPAESFPAQTAKLSFVHARDVSTAVLACYRLQQLALGEWKGEKDRMGDGMGKYSLDWARVLNTGLNIGSLEQVTLLEYLYLIGNTLGKPVFVYGSHNGRETMLKQRIKAMTLQQQQSKSDDNPINFLTRVYPKSYNELYLEYYTAHYDIANNSAPIPETQSTNPSTPSQNREVNRPNLQFFHHTRHNCPEQTPDVINASAIAKLGQVGINQVLPRLDLHTNNSTNTCLVCEKYLPDAKFKTQDQEKWMTEWNQNETPVQFLNELIAAGYNCPLESSSDSSASSSSGSDSDDSDYDDFFSGSFAKEFINPVMSKEGRDKISKMSRKAKVALVVKQTLSKQRQITMSDDIQQQQTGFDKENLDHLKVLHLLERLETGDQCTYLPSVTQGPISIQKALDLLPGWIPTCLYAWATKQTIWYSSTSAFMNGMDADPRNAIWQLDEKWRKYF